jgi:hypothetical protein
MPAIPASGAISLSDFATEFGGTPPHSMSEYYRNGANVPSNNSNVPTAGAFSFGQMRGAINEIILAATSGANVDISGLFGANWTSTVPKRLTIGSGVTIGGTGSSAAIIIPSNMAGTLEIDNDGSILGFGGAANGGAGGNAIQNLASGVTINNTGLLAGGGGGGGGGGAGGSGQFETVTYRSYHGSNDYWQRGGRFNIADNEIVAVWGGSLVINVYGGGGSYPSSITSYGIYRRGSFFSSSGKTHYYGIGQASTTYTTGGAGGSGGVGQGYSQTNTSGSGGASGGTNAGSGGTGGSGAAYGTAGSTGATGANGNASNGSGGASGGAAGAAVTGTSVSMNNTGTIYGAVA